MKNFLKIEHQDGLIYFRDFRIADLISYPNEEGNLMVNIDVKSYDGPYSVNEVRALTTELGQINNDFAYCWIELRDYLCTEKKLQQIFEEEIKISEGYNVEGSINAVAHAYFGWSIELKNNSIRFQSIDDKVKLTWLASSEDVNYYDNRAKNNNFLLECELNVIEFSSEKEYYDYLAEKDEKHDLYYSILRTISETPIEEDNENDISDIPKGDTDVENSRNAWHGLEFVKKFK
ncbi:MAG: hypothetical protein ABJN84_18230 [Flavobacteriaceae bacterium]